MRKIIPILCLFALSIGCRNDNGNDFGGAIVNRFTEVSGDAIGIDFQNTLIESKEINILTYEYIYNGGGVGVGDFNNDGFEDLYFTATMSQDKLYINNGDGTFRDVTESSNLMYKEEGFSTGVVIVDINNDGLDDIYVCRTGDGAAEDRKNRLYVNKGNLNFEEEADLYGIASNHHSNHGNFFDYDNDGDLDLFLVNHPVDFKNSQKIRVERSDSGFERVLRSKTEYDSDQLFRNNGDGGFTDVSSVAGVDNYGYGLSVSILDVNNDGWDDIYVANDYLETDKLYVNQRNGKFSSELKKYFRHISENSMGSDVADINNDGFSDLIVLDMLAKDLHRQKALVSSMSHERYHSLIGLGYEPQQMRNVLQLNNGNGSFSEIGHLAGVEATDWSWSSLFADFDQDGLKDLYVSNGYRRDVTDCDYTMYKSDSLANSNGMSLDDYLGSIPVYPSKNNLFRNNGNLTFSDFTENWGIETETYSNGSAIVDIDNDGLLDIVVNNIDQSPTIYKNNGPRKPNSIQIEVVGPANNLKGIGTNLKLYCEGEIISEEIRTSRGYFSSISNKLSVGVPEGKMIDSIMVYWNKDEFSIIKNNAENKLLKIEYSKAEIIKKLNKTDKDPIFQKVDLLPIRHTENDFDDLLAQHLMPHNLSRLGPAVTYADLNEDGLDDLYVGASLGERGQIYMSSPNGYVSIEKPFFRDTIHEDTDAVFTDLDFDGDLDLVIASGGNLIPSGHFSYQDRIYINSNGSFQIADNLLPELRQSTGKLCLLDFDNDGDTDLFLGSRTEPGLYPVPPQSHLLENIDGKFKDVTEEKGEVLSKLGMITSAEWIDLDGDSKKELIIAGEYLPISVFSFDNKSFKEKPVSGLEKSHGWWNCIKFYDFDKDGDLDIIGGNLGFNSKYKASESNPFEVFAKDFDNSGSIDAFLCNSYNGKAFPLVQRGDVVKQIPFLQRKLLNYKTYSTLDIEGLLGDMMLEEALNLGVYSFASSIFLNEGGRFKRLDLPNEAQMSPIRDIMIEEDANSNILIYTVGNDAFVHIEAGPYDAGNVNVLRYNSESLEFVHSSDTGFNTIGDMRKIGKIKTPKGEVVFVAINNDFMEFYNKTGLMEF